MSDFKASKSVVDQAISSWRQGDSPDTSRVLQDHPELLNSKQRMLDLAYEEYCLRLESGEQLEASTFCEGFSTYQDSFQKSLRRLIDVHDVMGIDDEELMEGEHWPQVGERFLSFELLGELGKGGFARVFLAKQPSLGNRHVAVKVSWMDGEAKTLGKLDHENITPVFSVDQDVESGLTAICMPFIGVSTLRDVREFAFPKNGSRAKHASVILDAATRSPLAEKAGEKRLPDALLRKGSYVEGVLHLGQQLADALALTHEMGILHRDLKPSNVLLTASGKPKLLDFNLSSDDELDVNRLGGTLPYMPPEQITAVFGIRPSNTRPPEPANAEETPGSLTEVSEPTAKVDAHSDVFSLGVILYELLSGKLPFGAPSKRDLAPVEIAEELMEKQSHSPTPLHTLNPDVDRRVSDLIHRCLHVDAKRRPQTARELANLLQAEISPTRRLARLAWRRRYLLLVMAIVTFGVLVGLAIYRDGYEARLHGKISHALALNDDEQAKQFASELLQFAEATENKKRSARESRWLAYCLALHGNTKASSVYYDLLTGGLDNVEVRNNLGVCTMSRDLATARHHFDQAVFADGDALAPRINRASLQVFIAQREEARRRALGIKGEEDGADARVGLDDVQYLIERGVRSKEVHTWGAILAAIQHTKGEADVRLVVDHVRQALELGQKPGGFQGGLFKTVKTHPEFQNALKTEGITDRSLPTTMKLIRPATATQARPAKQTQTQLPRTWR